MLRVIARHPKAIAWFFVAVLYTETVAAAMVTRGNDRGIYPAPFSSVSWKDHFKKQRAVEEQLQPLPKLVTDLSAMPSVLQNMQVAFRPGSPAIGGPTQPEMQAFSSVNANNMVDLFSGDFSYNIPLMDVGGYPIGLSYRGGISMDQEASWVGLGWNVNPGTITRNMRGLPDDFDGRYDSVRKVTSIKDNKTVGVTTGADVEIVGLPLGLGASVGVFHNNYRGWGLEYGVNASINAGIGSSGGLSGGLSITNNTQEGLTITPSLSMSFSQHADEEHSLGQSSTSISAPYNSRAGLKALQVNTGIKIGFSTNSSATSIDFASPTYTPSITIPFTSTQFSFTAKVGFETKVLHPSFFLSGYSSKQFIAREDTLLALPAYGYLHYQQGARNLSGLLDFNREKELPYREKPPVPHIAVPTYTYDAFSISGEGIGGMFRPYRADIGFINDHFIRTKDISDKLSTDVGIGDLVHTGVDLNINRAFTQNSPWLEKNTMKDVVRFQDDSADYQAVYFRNPGEKAINSSAFYDSIGGDDVVTVALSQPNKNSSNIQATNYLDRYHNLQRISHNLLTRKSAIKPERDKRTQVISYLTAREADAGGLSKYIESYKPNVFDPAACAVVNNTDLDGYGKGMPTIYFNNRALQGNPVASNIDLSMWHSWEKGSPIVNVVHNDEFSIRWEGRLKAPETGEYTFHMDHSDDGIRIWLGDTLLINRWAKDDMGNPTTAKVNLIKGEFYKFKMEFSEWGGKAWETLEWVLPGKTTVEKVAPVYMYAPAVDSFAFPDMVKEKRMNNFRKDNHISEIDVLNTDGRRYVYGIPVYNLLQKEATFALNSEDGNKATGLAHYTHNTDNTAGNNKGKDNYFNSETMPAYAHSFLLTGILSTDYVDVTGNGISDDDLGDAVRFNYSKIRGLGNPYRWRAPFAPDSVTYNEGLKTYNRDDKGNYIYGEKELWYLHTIASKTMVATFTVEDRLDLPAITEKGDKYYDHSAKRLKEINLYSKADFMKDPTKARPIKTVHFEYSYELCKGINKPLSDSGKLTLKKVWFTYNGSKKGKENPYVFNYNAKNPDYNIRSYDRWANYKDPLQNPGSVTDNVIRNDEYPYSLQDSAAAAANVGAWMLDSINLPSGGSMKINFESDDYAYVQDRRAMQMFRIIGFDSVVSAGTRSRNLYDGTIADTTSENLYVYIRVPQAVATDRDVYRKYVQDIEKLYFRLYVKMPGDIYGNGYENVSCYADIDKNGGYGRVSNNIIWVKLKGINLKGDGDGIYSPLTKAASQFLRLNLPNQAYPGSEIGDEVDLDNAVKMLASMGDNIKTAFSSFDRVTRDNLWCKVVDTARTFVRLYNPQYRKFGGGHRVKRITIYDNWKKMTKDLNQRTALYGQEYTYTNRKEINGDTLVISSGVAGYEPGIGNDENPFHLPIEYTEKMGILGPVTLGYSEEPLGESIFPAASVGYSKVRVRTINYKNKKSANGFSETEFYTAYDFPVRTERTIIDDDTKKRYKPSIANFLRINAQHHLAISQGFKVELNDMHGKMRSQATFAETDSLHPVTYTANYYKVDNLQVEHKHLSNVVTVIKPDGAIDTSAVIGKDVELMMDMREQLSISNGKNVNINADLFTSPFPIPPVLIIPSYLSLPQREENLFRSVATLKVIQRYGIVDSVVSIDKGSKVSTRDVMYDSETGDAVLTRTQNEFNDPVYNFSYPSHWAYDGMGLAYKNIDAIFYHVNIKNGRIIKGMPKNDSTYFVSGDELIAIGKQKTGEPLDCDSTPYASYPNYTKLWAIDSSVLNGGPHSFYFIDRGGKPYNGFDVTIKIIRSGRRNILGAVGSVTTLSNPLVKNVSTGQYELVLNTAAKIVAASSVEFKQFWKVEDIKLKGIAPNCDPVMQATGALRCVKDGSGNNTGYQEGLIKNINPLSSTYGDSSWVLVGYNCLDCGGAAKWAITDSFRCARDTNGFYTGFVEHEETDTASCSPTSQLTRWITDSFNCTTCPKPPKWYATGNTRCVKDSDNVNTGYQEIEQRDSALCSGTYNSTRWVVDGRNCEACAQPAKWVALDSTRCVKDGSGNNTGYLQYLELDTAICSPTHDNTRWGATVQNCTACAAPANWRPTGVTRCVKDGSNNNTGYQEIQKKDSSVCSATYGDSMWVAAGLNCSACATLPQWKRTGVIRCVTSGGGTARVALPGNTGDQEAEEIDTSNCSTGLTRWVNIGQNLGACPLPCDTLTNCSGPDKRCIDGNCLTGTKIYTYAYIEGDHVICIYHYEWYTDSEVLMSHDYSERHEGTVIPCDVPEGGGTEEDEE